ncbi:hypothetical protein ABIB00_007879 [Bradyrhizobium sp. LB14.3]
MGLSHCPGAQGRGLTTTLTITYIMMARGFVYLAVVLDWAIDDVTTETIEFSRLVNAHLRNDSS